MDEEDIFDYSELPQLLGTDRIVILRLTKKDVEALLNARDPDGKGNFRPAGPAKLRATGITRDIDNNRWDIDRGFWRINRHGTLKDGQTRAFGFLGAKINTILVRCHFITSVDWNGDDGRVRTFSDRSALGTYGSAIVRTIALCEKRTITFVPTHEELFDVFHRHVESVEWAAASVGRRWDGSPGMSSGGSATAAAFALARAKYQSPTEALLARARSGAFTDPETDPAAALRRHLHRCEQSFGIVGICEKVAGVAKAIQCEVLARPCRLIRTTIANKVTLSAVFADASEFLLSPKFL